MRNLLPILLLLAVLPVLAIAAEPARSSVPEKYRWRLGDLYPSDAAWTDARAQLAKRIPTLSRHEGQLGTSARLLADALEDWTATRQQLERLFVYAMARSDEDTRVAGPREMRQEAEQLAVALDGAVAYLRPEILALPPEKVRAFLQEEPRLKPFAFFLDDLLRWRKHTLGPKEERIIARAGELTGAGRSLQGILSNADIPWPTVKLSTGESVRLDQAGYAKARTSRNPEDRRKVFQAFFQTVKQYERTLGTALDAHVKGHLFEKDVRDFPSALEKALFASNIPPAVYRQLIADVNASLPTLHRYLALRKRMLGIDKLRYEDLYAPLVKGIDRRFTPDQGMQMTLAAMAPLGPDYVKDLNAGFTSGWTDFLPATGKRSGAYSTGVYGVHPYQLLNYNGQWTDVSTLAHEAGHSMHTLLAMREQPYPTYDYPIFVAEVASTLNENLLFRHALKQAADDATRLSLLGEHLESLRTTLFRQTMFAEFELAAHERAEKGEALSGEKLTRIYLDIVRKYYGHDKGACLVDELYGAEWASVPHFFNYDFYVYQYATSLVASTTLAARIREDEAAGRTAARDRYLAMLSAGGSRYAIDLLRDAGVDMTTSEPFKAAMAEMNETMDEMERILAKGATTPPPARTAPAKGAPARPTPPAKTGR